jgi:phenylalanyl-tRNA synthetase beta chain
MKVSVAWLNERAGLSLDAQALSDQLTMAGLEVDEVVPAAGQFSNVVVGTITDAQPHPDADKLQVCAVDAGQDEALQIVCGAPNARTGLRVAVALVGAVLPGDFKIKPVKLRGVKSAGMLCSASELGMAEASDGILELPQALTVGTDLVSALGLDDHILDVDLTPNRGDCLSVEGLARELAALNGKSLPALAIASVDEAHVASIPVNLAAPEACPRYLARIVEGVDAGAATPLWMVERLRRAGIRPLNAIVDVANYVMIELGQPLHTFDRARLGQRIEVRMAQPKEKATLLDGREAVLEEDMLVIADESHVLAVAGIMGGDDCAVTDDTQDVVIESAFFAPWVINGRARRLGLHTDASHRFERGVDPSLAERAMARACELLTQIAGGKVGPLSRADSAEHIPSQNTIAFRPERCNRLLGAEIASAQMHQALEGLGMLVTEGEPWQVQVPSSRFDLGIEEDLIEEVARIVGYNQLPTRRPGGEVLSPVAPEESLSARQLGQSLESVGYQEVISYSFVSAEQLERVHMSEGQVALANPLTAELSVMRTSLLPGLLAAFGHNRRRQILDLRLYEQGQCFVREDELLHQGQRIAGILGGRRHPLGWAWSDAPMDFYDVKGDVERLLALTGEPERFRVEPADAKARAWLHPGQAADVRLDGEVVGWLGALHPQLLEAEGLSGAVFAFELSLDALSKQRLPRYQPISRYPTIHRDLAVLLSQDVASGQVADCVAESAGENLRDLVVFDVYSDPRLGDNQKSIGLGLVLGRFDRTLTDDEAEAVVGQVKQALRERFDAGFRE